MFSKVLGALDFINRTNNPNEINGLGGLSSSFPLETQLVYPMDLGSNRNEPMIIFSVYRYSATSPRADISKKAMLGSIGLPMPPSLDEGYGVEFEEINTQGMQLIKNLINQGKNISDLKSLGNFAGDAAGGIARLMFGDKFRDYKAVFGGNTNVNNPKAITFFTGVGKQSYEFSFVMMARSLEESIRINSIINAFKFYMHPSLAAGGDQFTQPEIFQIDFGPEAIARWLPKPERCVLESMTISYNGQEAPRFFKEGGAPVEVKAALTFKCISYETKQSISRKYISNNEIINGIKGTS